MAPQASEKYGLLTPDYQQIGCCGSNGIHSERVRGTILLHEGSWKQLSDVPLTGEGENPS